MWDFKNWLQGGMSKFLKRVSQTRDPALRNVLDPPLNFQNILKAPLHQFAALLYVSTRVQIPLPRYCS